MIDFHPDRIARCLENGLPGRDSQQKMAPSVRFTGQKLPDPGLSRQSSVLILLYPTNGTWSTVLIERTPYGPHGGQISFPGGKKDEGDASELETALREANEEIGIPMKEVEVLGALSKLYVPNSNFWISPFIACMQHQPLWQLDPKEVKSIIPVTLPDLFLPIHRKKTTLVRSGISIDAPYYDVKGHQVWGATAMILSEFEALIS